MAQHTSQPFAPCIKPFSDWDAETIYMVKVKEQIPMVDGLLFPGATILCGRPKQGKSWLALQIALGVAVENRKTSWYPVGSHQCSATTGKTGKKL